MAIWDAVIGPVVSIINKVIPDKAAAAQAVATLNQLQLQGQFAQELAQLQAITSAQSDINKVEAGSESLFVSGWRPMIGWVCAAALAYQYLARPLAQGIASAVGHPLPAWPGLDDDLWQLMMGMLGMGGLRSFDKLKGTATK